MNRLNLCCASIVALAMIVLAAGSPAQAAVSMKNLTSNQLQSKAHAMRVQKQLPSAITAKLVKGEVRYDVQFNPAKFNTCVFAVGLNGAKMMYYTQNLGPKGYTLKTYTTHHKDGIKYYTALWVK